MKEIEVGQIRIRIVRDSLSVRVGLSDAYTPFLVNPDSAAAPRGVIHIADASACAPAADFAVLTPVATGINDLGVSRLFVLPDGRYSVGISPMPGEPMHFMTFSADFREATLALDPADRWNSFLLDSMLRIFFSQVAALESAVLIHSSAVVTPAGAHLFMGKSGTGKSTHSRLWLSTFADCELLNDDNPLLQVCPDGQIRAYGTPWSGKTPCWRSVSAPLLSLTRLRRAEANAYTRLKDIEAFVAVIPGASVISHSRMLHDAVCTTLGRIVGSVGVGILDCLPDSDAARLCRLNVENK